MKMVNLTELEMFLNGELLHFKMGKGIVVNELECEEAIKELEAGNKVALKVGNNLTGQYLIKTGDKEIEITWESK